MPAGPESDIVQPLFLQGGTMQAKRVTAAAAAVIFVAAVLPVLAQDDPKIAKGKEVFTAQKCTMCHAVEGKGNKNNPLDDVGSKLKPEEIRKWVTAPKEMKADSKMKAYPNLAAEDLDALIAYLSSLKKKA
jgi:cytochrome c2